MVEGMSFMALFKVDNYLSNFFGKWCVLPKKIKALINDHNMFISKAVIFLGGCGYGFIQREDFSQKSL